MPQTHLRPSEIPAEDPPPPGPPRPHPRPVGEADGRAPPEARRWSVRATLLFSGGISLVLWAAIAAAIIAALR